MSVRVISDEEFEKITNSYKQILHKIEELAMQDPMKNKVFNSAEAAKILNISKRTLQELRNDREISFIKDGNRIRYTVKDIEDYLERKRIEAK